MICKTVLLILVAVLVARGEIMVDIKYWDSNDCSGSITKSDSYPANQCLPVNGSSVEWEIPSAPQATCVDIDFWAMNTTTKCARGSMKRMYPCNMCDDNECDMDCNETRKKNSPLCKMGVKIFCQPRDKSVLMGAHCQCLTKCQNCSTTVTAKVGECITSPFDFWGGGLIVSGFAKCPVMIVEHHYFTGNCTGQGGERRHNDGVCVRLGANKSVKYSVNGD